jgi:hypothetical protein
MRKWIKALHKWYFDSQKCEIMSIEYFVEENYIECTDYISSKIKVFSGQLTDELWDEIIKWCRPESKTAGAPTRVYIWGGNRGLLEVGECIAYAEPVDNYLTNKDLLKTGQGYGNKYHYIKRKEKLKICPTCGSEHPKDKEFNSVNHG